MVVRILSTPGPVIMQGVYTIAVSLSSPLYLQLYPLYNFPILRPWPCVNHHHKHFNMAAPMTITIQNLNGNWILVNEPIYSPSLYNSLSGLLSQVLTFHLIRTKVYRMKQIQY